MYRRGVSSLPPPPLAKVNGSTGINFRTPTERNKKGVRKFIPLVKAIEIELEVEIVIEAETKGLKWHGVISSL